MFGIDCAISLLAVLAVAVLFLLLLSGFTRADDGSTAAIAAYGTDMMVMVMPVMVTVMWTVVTTMTATRLMMTRTMVMVTMVIWYESRCYCFRLCACWCCADAFAIFVEDDDERRR